MEREQSIISLEYTSKDTSTRGKLTPKTVFLYFLKALSTEERCIMVSSKEVVSLGQPLEQFIRGNGNRAYLMD